MFILELTLRSWSHSEENKRRTLQRNDIAAAITRTDVFDFLVRPLCVAATCGLPTAPRTTWPSRQRKLWETSAVNGSLEHDFGMPSIHDW